MHLSSDLNDIKCTILYQNVENLYIVHISGPDWNEYRSCMKEGTQTKMACLKAQETKCKNASHRITKVLRLTTSSYDRLLERRTNLKILHLFRNPFAIINSRTETKGYPITDFLSNAAVLCNKMMLDYEGGIRLAKKYPGRVKMVFYEDIKSNVTEKMNKLYDYIGMERNNEEVNQWNTVVTNNAKSKVSQTRVLDNAHWWRNHMSFVLYQGVRDKCIPLMTVFNMTNFNDSQELVEFNISEMNLPSVFTI